MPASRTAADPDSDRGLRLPPDGGVGGCSRAAIAVVRDVVVLSVEGSAVSEFTVAVRLTWSAALMLSTSLKVAGALEGSTSVFAVTTSAAPTRGVDEFQPSGASNETNPVPPRMPIESIGPCGGVGPLFT